MASVGFDGGGCVCVTLWGQFRSVGDRVKRREKKMAMEYFDPDYYLDFELMLVISVYV